MSLKRESNFLVARTGVTQSVITVHLKRFIQHIGQRRQQLLTSTRLSVYTGHFRNPADPAGMPHQGTPRGFGDQRW